MIRPTQNPRECPRRTGGPHTGFTLIEMLVVVAVIMITMTLVIPSFNSMRGGADFTSEVYDISGALDQARAYAMANNTYVLAGISELSASQSASATLQVGGTGRIAVALIASRDGRRPYQSLLNTNTLQAAWPALYGKGSTLFVPIGQLMTFQNIHLVDLQAGSPPLPASGNMLRNPVLSYYDIPNIATCVSAAPFAWPVGTALSGTPPAQYKFYQVIEFSPQGSARIILGSPSNNLDAIPYCIEIGLQPSHGTSINPPASGATGKIAANQIDGMSGATRISQPGDSGRTELVSR